MNKHYLLTVSRVVRETSEAISIEFSQPRVDRIQYKPGQYITVVVSIHGETYYRSYSMCSTPKLDEFISITIKRVPNGIVSNYLNDHAKEGMKLEIVEPAGKFYIENSVKFQRHIVLIGGGSGITPLMSICRAVLFNEPKSKVSLLYANRNQRGIIFKSQLDSLLQKFSHRFSVTHFLSQPEPETSLDFIEGRLDESKLISAIRQLPYQDFGTSFYLCGPQPLMDMCKSCLILEGINEQEIYTERFFVSPDEVKNQYKGDGKIRMVTLHFQNQTHHLQVPPGVPVLESALKEGISLPFSCKNGICSTCMGTIIQGKIHMEVKEGLLDFEIKKGRILLCQAHPLTDNVEVKV